MEKVHPYISNSLSNAKKGSLIFPTDFRGKGSEAAIHQSLSRLVRQGKLKRLTHGIYYIPKSDPLFGELKPGIEEVAEMIAHKEKVRIKPAGGYALNKLGLSTQVPTKLVYITDGSPRLLKIGKQTLRFKAVSPKKLSMKGKLSSLIIQALEELDLEGLSKERETRIKELLLKENPADLKHDLAIAPGRINDYIVKLLKSK